MTSRGGAVLEVRGGLAAVMACREIAAHVDQLFGPDDRPVPLAVDADGGALRPRGGWAGLDSGSIELQEVNWFDDAALVEAAPSARWQVFLSPETEQPGLWLAYTPQTGLVEGAHVGHEVMVPAAWVDPAGRTGDDERYLARIQSVRALLAGPVQDESKRTALPAATSAAAVPPRAHGRAGMGVR